MSASPQSPLVPIDMQCGLVLPVRATSFAMLGRYEYRHGKADSSEKLFPAHVINVTTSGTWEFRGRGGRSQVCPGTVTLGLHGDRFSCVHDHLHSNSNLILALNDEAIDGDMAGPIFDAQVLKLPSIIPMLQRALWSASDDEFESCAFEVFDWVSKASLGTPIAKGSSLRMQRVKRFIEQHAFEDICLADISAIVRLNPFVCLRQFKQATGTTPHAYLVECRAKEARRLLRTTNVSVEEVANRTGFDDQAYFSRVFKRSTGLTPTEYRKQHAG